MIFKLVRTEEQKRKFHLNPVTSHSTGFGLNKLFFCIYLYEKKQKISTLVFRQIIFTHSAGTRFRKLFSYTTRTDVIYFFFF